MTSKSVGPTFCILTITLESDKGLVDLFQRLFIYQRLHAKPDTHKSHHGVLLTEKEMTLTLENMLILLLLQLIYPSLPKLVKQCYGTESRLCTLTSIKTEISQAIESLLEKLSNNMSVNWAFTTHQDTKKLYESLKKHVHCAVKLKN